ncbi:oligogalacturonate lyase [Caulobacter sp. D4A]|uniref:oligogalacturonate lyase family protein n=1 Tax=unclassified Caulobacter TaxID=2648921 RepID=UPI000D736A7E|nr:MULTISPECIES: oligogalacturonate lyase family protein [unclassified Caulobacter]PXA91147.1 oligogalacturonate lyase [Caulobacter sp. D5]PXA91513.1 oligogalacturonate lyase [Caulobacter sp. D4A]
MKNALIGLATAFAIALPAFAPSALAQTPAAEPPREWIDKDTGHRVVRLSDEPGSSSLYFNFNGYTPQGDKLVISTPKGLSTVDLATRKLAPLVEENGKFLFVGRKTRSAYFIVTEGETRVVKAVDIDSKKVRIVATFDRGDIQTINADETLLGGVVVSDPKIETRPDGVLKRDNRYDQAAYAANGPDGKPLPFAEAKEVRLNERLDSKIPMEMFVIDLRTGQKRVVHAATDWLNHLQFSPTDPNLLMFCHEGPWHKVDRLWLLRTDEANAKPVKIHTRTMNMEIAGHEWFSADGKTVWYDLQTPRGEDFWVAGYEIATGKRTWYHVERNAWSVHFNSSPDGKLFAGDGGDAEMVAHAPDGKWLYLMHPRGIPDVAGIHAPDSEHLIRPGVIDAERLVNMSGHDYRLEPNVNFTPDGKWLVFRSNMHGGQQVYAVELAKPASAQ